MTSADLKETPVPQVYFDTPKFTLLKGFYEVCTAGLPPELQASAFWTGLIQTANEVQKRRGYPIYDGIMAQLGFAEADGIALINELRRPLAQALLRGGGLKVAAYKGFSMDLSTSWGTTPYKETSEFHLKSVTKARIFYLLLENGGRVVPYDRILQFAWGIKADDRSVSASELIKPHITHLRQIIDPSHSDGGEIRSHFFNTRGVGYVFQAGDPSIEVSSIS